MRVFGLVCVILWVVIFATPAPADQGVQRVVAGDASKGRVLFTSLRCDSCHAVWGSGSGAQHPLPDLSAEPPVAIAARITQRAKLAPEMRFDELTMSFVVSNVTEEEIGHVATYLSSPRPSRR